MAEDNEDVVHVGSWEVCPTGDESKVLIAFADWRRGEPLRNVEIAGLEGDVDVSVPLFLRPSPFFMKYDSL